MSKRIADFLPGPKPSDKGTSTGLGPSLSAPELFFDLGSATPGLLAAFCQRAGIDLAEARQKITRKHREDRWLYRLAAEVHADSDLDGPVTHRELDAALDGLRDELADTLTAPWEDDDDTPTSD